MADDFYWRHARDSLLTTSAVQMYSLLVKHEGKVFDEIKGEIDDEYRVATGSTASDRHGGIIQTQIQTFREAGWISLDSEGRIVVTDAGRQALILLDKAPGFLKAAPTFLLELLARYQLRNPSRPPGRDQDYEEKLKGCDVFPYWTLFKVMRECGNRISISELRRFVFRLHNSNDIDDTIQSIKSFRTDQANGLSDDELNTKYPPELEGAVGEPKYLMARLGTHVGTNPAVVEKEGSSNFVLNKYYLPLIDSILAEPRIFMEHISENSWIDSYGQYVQILKSGELDDDVEEELPRELSDADPILLRVNEMIVAGASGVLLSGPPGTSKSWYARKLAAHLADGDGSRVRFKQFHASYAYDDFVEGYVPLQVTNGVSFEVVPKVFLSLCEKAREVEPRLCILVIDEINRGDTSKIFGEVLTYIEADYREKTFHLTYSGKPFRVPKNLFLIGTYNPYDRSVTELDDAFERRFERIALDPNIETLVTLLKSSGFPDERIAKVVDFFTRLNGVSRHGFGHALFLGVKDDVSLMRLWESKLRFMIDKAFKFEPERIAELLENYRLLLSDAELASRLK